MNGSNRPSVCVNAPTLGRQFHGLDFDLIQEISASLEKEFGSKIDTLFVHGDLFYVVECSDGKFFAAPNTDPSEENPEERIQQMLENASFKETKFGTQLIIEDNSIPHYYGSYFDTLAQAVEAIQTWKVTDYKTWPKCYFPPIEIDEQ